jgi:hypothetical protein
VWSSPDSLTETYFVDTEDLKLFTDTRVFPISFSESGEIILMFSDRLINVAASLNSKP